MNVLLALPWEQLTGGVTHVAVSLARALRTRGHQASFLFPEARGFGVRTGTGLAGFPATYCRLRRFPPDGASWRDRVSWYSTVVTTLPQLVRRGRSEHVDLINVHYPGEGFALLVDLARWLRVPLVISAHGSDLLPDDGPNRTKGLLRQFESADAVVVPSQGYLRSVVSAFPSLRGKIRCIHNGYDEEEVSPRRAPMPPAGQPDVTALCIASLIRKKGIDVLLHGLRKTTSSGLKVRLVGEGPLRRELEALSAELGVLDRVSFLGPKDRAGILEELARCDFLVMPSRHASESFGLSVLEAMACGKPVVASAIGGLTELVADGQTGLLVRPEEPAELAQALDRLAKDPDLRASFGLAGLSKAKQFTVRANADKYEALFSELVARSR